MRQERINLKEAIELESQNLITIYFTNQVDIGNIFNPKWYNNYKELANKFRKIPIGELINYLDPEYEIEIQLPFEKETQTMNWVYLYGKKSKEKDNLYSKNENGKYVYILTNKVYPTICKIGKAVNPEKRVKQINGAWDYRDWETDRKSVV